MKSILLLLAVSLLTLTSYAGVQDSARVGNYVIPYANLTTTGLYLVIDQNTTALYTVLENNNDGSSIDWVQVKIDIQSLTMTGDVASLDNLLDGYTPIYAAEEGPKLCCFVEDEFYCWAYECLGCLMSCVMHGESPGDPDDFIIIH